ncbi:response regulator [Desertibaculum subflavum]|uniref:response regulator n=1 Tax=Desertibaculum subflavum TaxID=2268458 RepID=UPI000E6742ED
MTTTRRLLAIDDDPDFADLVAQVAGQLGYAAVATTVPADFMAQYLGAPPDVIVMDIVMPEQDGIDLMRWLVAQGCRARIVIVSGYNPAFANAAKLIGEFGGRIDITYLQKPVKLDDLRAALA